MSCNREPNNSWISKKDYQGYLNNLPDENFSERYTNCQNIFQKDLLFEFEMDSRLELDTSNCTFLILRGGTVSYRGKYNRSIKIEDVRFCLDNNLTRISSWAFIFLDKKTETVYKFYQKDKEVYNFSDKEKISVKLSSKGYKIKFDDDWFFK
jgi:hypothetical protein